MAELGENISRGLDALAVQQLPSGELPAYASALDGGPADWVPDRLNFITALAAEALGEVGAPRADALVDRAVGFLRREREPGALWRYWSRENERVAFTPPDADDTACCSMAVALRGDDTRANRAVLRATAAPDGRYRTWLVPHETIWDPRVRWWLRGEGRKETGELRAELWASTEAERGDIDAVVNANVCRYLGPERASAGARRWVAEVVEAGDDTHDKWHRRLPTLWASVADGARRGIGEFEAVGPAVLRLVEAFADEGSDRRDVDLALSLLAVQRFDGSASLQRHLAAELTARQRSDGLWARDIFYFGGPDEVFGWASEALVTAYAVASLAGCARTHP